LDEKPMSNSTITQSQYPYDDRDKLTIFCFANDAVAKYTIPPFRSSNVQLLISRHLTFILPLKAGSMRITSSTSNGWMKKSKRTDVKVSLTVSPKMKVKAMKVVLIVIQRVLFEREGRKRRVVSGCLFDLD
jgi:hypothetical protein